MARGPGAPDSGARWSEWMARANQGDSDAYGSLLEEIGDVIDRYLRRRFGDPEFVADCTQECLLAIHRARASYDERRDFRAWMFAIVRHKAIDLLRRGGVRSRVEALGVEPPERAAPTADPIAALDTARLLAALRPEHRDALVRTRLEGCSIAEAAAAAGISVPAMKSRVSRALRAARAWLEAEAES